MSKITYANKEAINVDTSIPNKNKATADDFNEIKRVVNENEDHQIVIIKDVYSSLPSTTGYSEGDNIYLMSANDNLIYTLTNGAWVSAGAPNTNKYYLLINNKYISAFSIEFIRGIYKCNSYGYIWEKVADYSNSMSSSNNFNDLKSGTYLYFSSGAFTYYTMGTTTVQINVPALSTVSIFKQDEATQTVGDMFLIRTTDNKTILGTITAINILGKTWSIKNYYDALQVRKSTDVSTLNMYQLFKDEAGSPTQTLLWILDNTFTLNYTEYGTQESKSFTFSENDMVQGNSQDCVGGTPMIVYKANGERYKITNLTVTGTSYLITKLDEGTLLYSSNATTPSTSDITLNDSLANYEYIEILFKDSVLSSCGSTKIYQPDGKVANLFCMFQGSSGVNCQFKNANYNLSGNKMTLSNNYGEATIYDDDTNGASKTLQLIVYRVIGYK